MSNISCDTSNSGASVALLQDIAGTSPNKTISNGHIKYGDVT